MSVPGFGKVNVCGKYDLGGNEGDLRNKKLLGIRLTRAQTVSAVAGLDLVCVPTTHSIIVHLCMHIFW